MDKTAIKNFAVRARNKLIEQVKQKAFEIGIEKDKIVDPQVEGTDSVKIYNRYLDKDEIRQRDRLINEIEIKGYEQVIEEVAYTWFNRFVALRFMEVNGYLPSGVRVLSSENAGKAEPDIVTEVLNIVDLDIDTETVYQYQDDNDTNGLFKYILIKQCNSLNDIMPFIFEKIDDYTEILLPNNLLSEGSVIRDMVESISEGDWREKVEIIGWLYQYYNSEKKDEVFASKKKIKKDEIPAATQLFTNDWIVKYMVENTLGRMWIESNPDSQLINKWDYYIKESEQEAEVIKKLKLMSMSNVNPRDIKILDPSCGSGHILVYAFDVLYDIYEKSGFMKNDIPLLILKNNLFGLDIDDRAAQLAYFSLLMKARGFDKEIFTKDIKVNVSSIIESNDIDKNIILNLIDEVSGLKKKEELKKEIIKLIDYFKDAKYYGSLITVHNIGLDIIKDFLDKIKGYNFSLFDIQYIKILREKLPKLIKQSRIISQKYNVVITNPPYMGNRYMNKKLKNFLKEQYNAYNKDLFSVFIKRCFEFADNNGYISMITMESWMFLKSFDSLRREIINDKTIINLIHMPYEGKGRTSLGINFGTTAFTVRNIKIENYSTNFSYIRHTDIDEEGVPSIFPVINNRYGYKKVDMFTDIPSFPLAYWADESTIKAYENGKLLGDIAEARLGMATANNNRFIRSWFEIDINKLGLGFKSRNQAKNNDYKWFPYNKGGNFRKWYGNNEYVVNWENDGYEIRNFKDKNGRVRSHNYNLDYIFKQSITWTFISSAKFGVRYSPQGFIFDVGGSSVFPSESDIFYITAFMCSKLSFKFLKIQNPTLNFQVGNISDLPIIKPNSNSLLEKINNLTKTNIELSKNDWDSFETSWNFKEHPLLANKRDAHTIQEAFDNWSDFADKQFYQLKENEEELNRIFIDIYGLENELTPEVDEDDVTIRKADRERDIKSFISYAVGFMLGRYSLDEEGLVYAGGKFDESRYETFKVDRDGIIPILDDEYFDDDIVARFIEFLKVTFGEEHLEENIDYIAETLGRRSRETSRQAIRRYFVTGFIKDHVSTYNKRPIYWLFQSDGRRKAFNALIYMHRYDSGTVARVRTDYLHELQKKIEAEKVRLQGIIDSDLSAREINKARKKLEKLNKDTEELIKYDEVLNHIANQQIEINLDDGVQENYEKFADVLTRI